MHGNTGECIDRNTQTHGRGVKNMSAATFRICRLRLDDGCQLSATHAHQIIHYMKNMIGITSTRVHGQDIYISYEPGEASACQVKNYLCAAVYLFGSKWRNEVRRAFHHCYGGNEAAA